MAVSYAQKLKDPRWQKKRLEILSRDEFTCQWCGSKEKTLHVHHFYYNAVTRNPWDVDDDGLITLCEDCHYVESLKLPEVIRDIITAVSIGGGATNPDVGVISPFFRQWIIEIIIKYYPKSK